MKPAVTALLAACALAALVGLVAGAFIAHLVGSVEW